MASRPSLFSGAGRGPDESLRHAWQKHVQDRIMHLAPITMLEEKSVVVPQLPLFIKLKMMCDYEVSQENCEELGMVQGLTGSPETARGKTNLHRWLGRPSPVPEMSRVRSGSCPATGLQGVSSLSLPPPDPSLLLWNRVEAILCLAHFMGKEGKLRCSTFLSVFDAVASCSSTL